MDYNLKIIGEEIVHCKGHCLSVLNESDQGIIPRGMILEKRNGIPRCMVVGINPGKCNADEKNFYLNNGVTYNSLEEYFEKIKDTQGYFKKTKEILSLLGYGGDILWTDLVKCEWSEKSTAPPIETIRICANKFLVKEVEFFNPSIIFTLSNIAFTFCAYRFPNNLVVGLPHPNSRGNLSKLRADIIKNKDEYLLEISKKETENCCRAIHLSRIH